MLILVALKYATLYTYAAISGAQTHNELQTHAALLAIQWLGVYVGALLVTSLATGLVSAGDAEAENDGEDRRANVPEKYPRAYALLVYSAILLPAYTVAATLLAINKVVDADSQPPKTEVLIDLVFSSLAIVFAVSMLYHLQISAVPAWPTRFLLAVVFFCVVLEGNRIYASAIIVFVVAEALSTVVALLVPGKFSRFAASVGALVEYFVALVLFLAVLDNKIGSSVKFVDIDMFSKEFLQNPNVFDEDIVKDPGLLKEVFLKNPLLLREELTNNPKIFNKEFLQNPKFDFDAQLVSKVDFINAALNITFIVNGGFLLIKLFLGVKDLLQFFRGNGRLDNTTYVPLGIPIGTTSQNLKSQ